MTLYIVTLYILHNNNYVLVNGHSICEYVCFCWFVYVHMIAADRMIYLAHLICLSARANTQKRENRECSSRAMQPVALLRDHIHSTHRHMQRRDADL